MGYQDRAECMTSTWDKVRQDRGFYQSESQDVMDGAKVEQQRKEWRAVIGLPTKALQNNIKNKNKTDSVEMFQDNQHNYSMKK